MTFAKVWDGSGWTQSFFRNPMVWDGSQWVFANPKPWNGSNWGGLALPQSRTITIGSHNDYNYVSVMYYGYGYNVPMAFGQASFGSLSSSANIPLYNDSPLSWALYYYDVNGIMGVRFGLEQPISDNSAVDNSSWTTMTLNGNNLNRVDATFNAGSRPHWQWTVGSNIMGTSGTASVSWS